jgi:hypothetical protein
MRWYYAVLLALLSAPAQPTRAQDLGEPSASTVHPDTAAAAPAPPVAPAVTTAGATVRMGGLIQVWFLDESAGAPSTFRLRRAELKLSGQLDSRVRWTLMLDAAKAIGLSSRIDTVAGQGVVTASAVSQASRILQDAYLELELGGATVEVGQLKLPIGREALLSSGQLSVVERGAYISDRARGGGIAFTREVGAVVSGALLGIGARVGAFNGFGESMGSTDRVAGKVLATRLTTGARALRFGTSGAVDVASTGYRDRLGVDALVELSGWGLQLEALRAREEGTTSGGAYAQLTRELQPRLEAVARADVWDPDLHAERAAEERRSTDLLLGISWQAAPNVRLQLNAVERVLAGTREHRYYTNLQTSW